MIEMELSATTVTEMEYLTIVIQIYANSLFLLLLRQTLTAKMMLYRSQGYNTLIIINSPFIIFMETEYLSLLTKALALVVLLRIG